MRNIYISLLIISLSACHDKTTDSGFESFDNSSFSETLFIEGEILPIEIYQNIGSIHLKDSLLFATTVNSKRFLDIYDPINLKVVNSVVHFGRGPSELLGLASIDFHEDTIWFLDNQEGKIISFAYHDILTSNNATPKVTFFIKDMAMNLIKMSTGDVVTDGLQAGTRFVVYNDLGEQINTRGQYPFNIDGISDEGHDFIVNQANMCTFSKTQEDDIYIAYKMSDLIEKYDRNLNLIRRIHGPLGFAPSISERSDGKSIRIRPKDDNRSGYFCPRIIGDELWVLYSGVLWNETVNMGLMDTIMVFDLDLNPLRIYKLDIPTYTFDVDIENSILYTVCLLDGYYCFVKFSLALN